MFNMSRIKPENCRFAPKPLLDFFHTGWRQVLLEDPYASSGVVEITTDNGILAQMTAIEFWECIIKEADSRITKYVQTNTLPMIVEVLLGEEGTSQGTHTLPEICGTYLHRLTIGNHDWFHYQDFPYKLELIQILFNYVNIHNDVDHILQMKLMKALYISPCSVSYPNEEEPSETDSTFDISEMFDIETVLQEEKTVEENQRGIVRHHRILTEAIQKTLPDINKADLCVKNNVNNSPITVNASDNISTAPRTSMNYFDAHQYRQINPPYAHNPHMPVSFQNQFPPLRYLSPRTQHFPLPVQHMPSPNQNFSNRNPILPRYPYLPRPNALLPHPIPYLRPQIPPPYPYVMPQNQMIVNPNMQIRTPNQNLPPQNLHCLRFPYGQSRSPVDISMNNYYHNIPSPISRMPVPPQVVDYIDLSKPELCTPPRVSSPEYESCVEDEMDISPSEIRTERSQLPPTPSPNTNIPRKTEMFSLEEIEKDALEFDFQLLNSDEKEKKPIKPPQTSKRKYFRHKKGTIRKSIQSHTTKSIHVGDGDNRSKILITPIRRKVDENLKAMGNKIFRYLRRRKRRNNTIGDSKHVIPVDNQYSPVSTNSKTLTSNKNIDASKIVGTPKRRYFQRRKRPNMRNISDQKDIAHKRIKVLTKPATSRQEDEIHVGVDAEEKILLQNISNNWKKLTPRRSLSFHSSLENITENARQLEITSTSTNKLERSIRSSRVYISQDQCTQTSNNDVVITKIDQEVQTDDVPK